MRLDGTFGDEHTLSDFRIGVTFRSEDDGLPLPFGQSAQHGSGLISARLGLLRAKTGDKLLLTGRIELRKSVAYVDHPPNDVFGSIRFGNEALRSGLNRPLDGV